MTKRGAPAVVVIAIEDYARLRQLKQEAARSFADHLLPMPTDSKDFERLEL